jgi:hypothetical protein
MAIGLAITSKKTEAKRAKRLANPCGRRIIIETAKNCSFTP